MCDPFGQESGGSGARRADPTQPFPVERWWMGGDLGGGWNPASALHGGGTAH